MALGTRSARCACVRRPPTPPLLSHCSCGFALANPPLVSAARSSYKIETTRSLYTFPRCAAVGDGSALPQHDPHPAAGPLAQRASVAEDDWSVSGPTLDPLTGRSSCCRLPGRYRRRAPPALSVQQQPSTMLHTGARAANRVRNLRRFSFLCCGQSVPELAVTPASLSAQPL